MQITSTFENKFGYLPEKSSFTPERVKLIREHINYNGGMVLPTALDLGIWVSFKPRPYRKVRVYSDQFEVIAECTIDDTAADSGLIGEEHDPETHLVPIALQAAAGLRTRMKIFGADYDTPDGTCLRDYIHVNDIALAHILSEKAFDGGIIHAEVNIGTGHTVSNLEILQTIEHVTGRVAPYDNAPRRVGDVTKLFTDGANAKEILGFEPQHSDIENIIQTAWAFHGRKWGLNDID